MKRALVVRRPSSAEQGSVTVVMLGVISVLLMLTVSGLVLGSALVASHRARAAADLGALGAASALMQGLSPGFACHRAARIAAANYGTVRLCIASGMEVRLTVAVAAAVQGVGVATARSRAGPGQSRAVVP